MDLSGPVMALNSVLGDFVTVDDMDHIIVGLDAPALEDQVHFCCFCCCLCV